jgi:outer membrane protein insertion porin family
MGATWRIPGLLAALVLGACSALQPAYLADKPGPEGKAPVPVEVGFTGNHDLGTLQLRRVIEDFMLDLSKDPTREAAVYDAALELENLYRTSGYPVAKVDYDYRPPPEDAPWPQRVQPVFHITEGPLVTVELQLAGNHAYSAAQLLPLWSRRRTGLFGLGPPVFVEAQVRSFAEALQTFYRAHGRLDAVVSPPQIEVDLQHGLAHARIEIQDGHAYAIRNVELAAALRAALGTDLPPPPGGKAFSEDVAQDYGFALRAALRRKGHPRPHVELHSQPVPGADHRVDLDVTGTPGVQATVAAVELQGNKRTMSSLIRGKLALHPGDPYDGDKVDEALRRLYRTGLFRVVEITDVPVRDDPTHVDMKIRVEEIESRSVETLVGYGSYEELRGGLRLEERNLFGTGRDIALDNRVSMKGYGTGLTLTDADFLDTESTLAINGEYFRREQPSFVDRAAGGTVALSRELLHKLTARLGYTYHNRTGDTTAQLPQNQLVDYVEGRVFVELRNDRRDNLLFPKSGHVEFLSFERIAPVFGADVDLDRLVFRASVHVPLFDSARLVLRTEQGALWPHDGAANVPLQERFFSGGQDSVRSFRESQLGPKDSAGLPIGGEFRNLFGAELRLPLVGTFEAAAFVDAGNVGSRVQDFNLSDMRYGIGAGLRLLLPIGPVRLDGGWNPDRRPGDRAWTVLFSVGYPF